MLGNFGAVCSGALESSVQLGTVQQCTVEPFESVYGGALWISVHSIQWGSLECVVKHCTVKQCREGHSGIVERGGGAL